MNYLIGTNYRGSLLGNSQMAKWHVFENTPHSVLEQIKCVHVYGLGDCQGALYITHQDEVYNIGFNGFALPSQNSMADRNEPQKIEGLSHRKIQKISVGLHYGIALNKSGTLYHWGRPVDEVNGYGKTLEENNNHSPHQLVGFCHVAKEIACGESFFAILTDNKQVVVTGWIHWEDKFYDKRLVSPDLVDVSSMSCGAQHVAMVSVDGTVYTCGWGGDGQLGYPWTENDGYLTTRKIDLLEPCTQTACGRSSTIFLTRSGSIWACGWNDNFSKLGVASDEIVVIVPQKVQLEGQFKEIASSYWATCSIYAALASDESVVFKWGNGCWSPSCESFLNSSIMEAFIDFPTPSNLGFSEQPIEDVSNFKYCDSFDWHCLTARDILFDYLTPQIGGNLATNSENIEVERESPESNQTKRLEDVETCPQTEHKLEPLQFDNLISTDANTIETAEERLRISSMTIFVYLAPLLTSVNIRLTATVFVAVLTQIFLFLVTELYVNNGKLAFQKSNNAPKVLSASMHETNIDKSTDPLELELSFSELIGNSRFSDVTFKLSDGEIPGHKPILYSRSDYFRQILTIDESLTNFNVRQFNVRAFRHFLKYLYIRNTEDSLNVETLVDLNEIARRFNEPNLYRLTLSRIRLEIAQSSLVYVMRKARDNSSKELRQIGIDFINQLKSDGYDVVDLIELLATTCR